MAPNRLWILLALSFMLASCSQQNPDEDKDLIKHSNAELLASIDPKDFQDKTFVRRALIESSISVNQSLEKMAKVEATIHPPKSMASPKNIKSLSQTVSIDWNGPIEPVLKQLAQTNHYRLKVLGNAPAIPILISLHADNDRFSEVIRNITYQSQKRATIQVYPKDKIIELRYKAP
jgi:defect-in-organelle-trafficking protein DotD